MAVAINYFAKSTLQGTEYASVLIGYLGFLLKGRILRNLILSFGQLCTIQEMLRILNSQKMWLFLMCSQYSQERTVPESQLFY